MKRLITILAAVLFTVSVFAQSPQLMIYQAVIRNSSGVLIQNSPVGMRVSILQGSATGTVAYEEIYNPNPQTNANGLVTIEVGSGIPVTGTFSGINWANGPYFVKTETDPTGGTSYTITGTSQLLSVPYALYTQTTDYNNLANLPMDIIPRAATKNQTLTVSFSGGDIVSFSQASNTCPYLYADVILFMQATSTQASPTTIYPVDEYYINSKRFDAIFDIPSYVPSGIYDIILSPTTGCPFQLNSSFKIY